MLRLDEQWLWLFRGGIQKEYDISVSGSGDAGGLNGTLTGGLGGFGEAGIYYVIESGDYHGAMSFTFRYTAIHDTAGDTSIPASNFGFLYSLYYNP